MDGTADVAVVGGGVFGLWVAQAAASAGLTVTLVEAGRIGAGASATPVGALTPFPRAPEARPDAAAEAMAAFQARGLLALPARAAALREATGRAPGYARTGRLMPVADAAQRLRAEAIVAAGRARFARDPEGGAAHWALEPAPPAAFAPCIAEAARGAGVLVDSVSARIDTAAWSGALVAALAGRARLLEDWPVARIDAASRSISGPRGRIAAGHLVLAAGFATAAFAPGLGLAPGRAVKGQAAWLAADLPDGLPVIQAPGLFLVRHGPGRVAIGATSEPGLTDPAPDAALEPVLERARALCPPLAGAAVTRAWGGIRPRPPGRMPQIGPVPGHPGFWLATGGFKIGLAIAHIAGEDLVAAMLGRPGALPAAFAPAPAEAVRAAR